jgi:hypothetical protein
MVISLLFDSCSVISQKVIYSIRPESKKPVQYHLFAGHRKFKPLLGCFLPANSHLSSLNGFFLAFGP